MGFVIAVIINAGALIVAARLVPQISFPAADDFPNGSILSLLIVALIFGVVNTLVKPIVSLLALPVRLMTLGLFTFVINAGLLLLVALISDAFRVDFTIGGFPPNLTADALVGAFLGALVISVVSTVVRIVIPD